MDDLEEMLKESIADSISGKRKAAEAGDGAAKGKKKQKRNDEEDDDAGRR